MGSPNSIEYQDGVVQEMRRRSPLSFKHVCYGVYFLILTKSQTNRIQGSN